jgi:hypothetical protein
MNTEVKYPLKGTCNCGDIHYEVFAPFLAQIACHCKQCQQHTQSAFSLNGTVRAGDFKITQGNPQKWTKTADSGNKVDCYFCPRCGNRIYHHSQVQPDLMRVKMGTLEDTRMINPTMHIWTEMKQDWYVLPDGVPSFPRQPSPKS